MIWSRFHQEDFPLLPAALNPQKIIQKKSCHTFNQADVLHLRFLIFIRKLWTEFASKHLTLSAGEGVEGRPGKSGES